MNAQISHVKDEVVNVSLPIIKNVDKEDYEATLFDFGRMDSLDFYRIVYMLKDVLSGEKTSTSVITSGTIIMSARDNEYDFIHVAPLLLAQDVDSAFTFAMKTDDVEALVGKYA